MSTGGQDTKWRGNITEKFNRLSRAHERYRQTDDRQTDLRWHIANLNVSSLKSICELKNVPLSTWKGTVDFRCYPPCIMCGSLQKRKKRVTEDTMQHTVTTTTTTVAAIVSATSMMTSFLPHSTYRTWTSQLVRFTKLRTLQSRARFNVPLNTL